MAYLTQTDLENRLSRAKVLAIYDDENDGTVNAAALADVLQTASDLVDGTIARSYTGTFPMASPPPVLAKEAAVLYAMALSIERAPEFLAQYGDKYLFAMRDKADKLCERIATGLIKVVDAPPPSPGRVLKTSLPLSNAGHRLVGIRDDGSYDTGDF